jgi:hypothetical protein
MCLPCRPVTKASIALSPVLERIRSRSSVEWVLAARALVSMATIVVAMRLLPYNKWRGLAVASGRVRRSDPSVVSAQQVVRAMESASRFVPGGANCLVRALTTRMLMARYCMSSTLRMGVAKTLDGYLEGHAWLEYQGAVLVGERGREGFAPMPDLEARL